MQGNNKRIRVLLSSPSNLAKDRQQIKTVIEEINLDYGIRENFFVEFVAWETHTWPAIGDYPQGIINQQFPDNIDIFFGMMGGHFGTPTREWGSGTEEEFRVALASWKKTGAPQIMFYFSNFSTGLSEIDPEQLSKRQTFKQELPKLGVKYESYEDTTDLHVLARRQISQAINNLIKNSINESDRKQNSDESFDVLSNYSRLLATDPLIAADNLLNEGAEALNNCASVQERLNKDIARVTKGIVDGTKTLKRAASQNSEKLANKGISRVYTSMNRYQVCLQARIRDLDSHYFDAITKLQRSIEIVKASKLEQKIQYQPLLSGIVSLRPVFRGLLEAVEFTNSTIETQNFGEGDLWLEQQKIVALHRDLAEYLTRVLRKNDEFIKMLDPSFDLSDSNA